ncbi:MAG TPA: murein L,D-transpeptidase catalytic domain family protein [Caulobacteraceae bacterium]|nr:murein L,D-transpeptidase catalytic domain family protein [Caulobacteraceae bacterium]
MSMPTTRRRLLQISGGVALAAAASPALALAPPPSSIVAAARNGLARVGSRIPNRDVVAVADFARPSAQARLHLVDVQNGRITSLLVAHGRGSDPTHTGWLSRFSNAEGSNCTSEGAFLTAGEYVGAHGRSMRLEGLDPSNDNAMARAIVIHQAAYVSPQIARASGVLGRSEGCFAVSAADLPRVLQQLGPGRLLVSARL